MGSPSPPRQWSLRHFCPSGGSRDRTSGNSRKAYLPVLFSRSWKPISTTSTKCYRIVRCSSGVACRSRSPTPAQLSTNLLAAMVSPRPEPFAEQVVGVDRKQAERRKSDARCGADQLESAAARPPPSAQPQPRAVPPSRRRQRFGLLQEPSSPLTIRVCSLDSGFSTLVASRHKRLKWNNWGRRQPTVIAACIAHALHGTARETSRRPVFSTSACSTLTSRRSPTVFSHCSIVAPPVPFVNVRSRNERDLWQVARGPIAWLPRRCQSQEGLKNRRAVG